MLVLKQPSRTLEISSPIPMASGVGKKLGLQLSSLGNRQAEFPLNIVPLYTVQGVQPVNMMDLHTL